MLVFSWVKEKECFPSHSLDKTFHFDEQVCSVSVFSWERDILHCVVKVCLLHPCLSHVGESGFLQPLSYIKPKQHSEKSRPRNVLWFNPSPNKTVKTNVGKQFLSLIDKHFPVNNPLRRIFNRGTIKVSYSCMKNMKCIINNHNSKVLRNTEAPEKTCNCRVKPNCPLDGACLTRNLVYKATVFPENQKPKTYIGMAEEEFKTRFRNHQQSFNNKKYALSTAHSKYIWELKEEKTKYTGCPKKTENY